MPTTVATVSFTITLSGLALASFDAATETMYKSDVATAVGLGPAAVQITGTASGSTLIDTTVYFYSGATMVPSLFASTIGTSPGNVLTSFADVTKYGNVSCASVSTSSVLSPTSFPTAPPTASPSSAPTSAPTLSPTAGPTHPPTSASPTIPPTASPTASPTDTPTTASPSTSTPTKSPSTNAPTSPPTVSPTLSPHTVSPTASPTLSPSQAPTGPPSLPPTLGPTSTPPTSSPTTPFPTSSVSPTTGPTTAPTSGATTPPTTHGPTLPGQTFAPSAAPTQVSLRVIFSDVSIDSFVEASFTSDFRTRFVAQVAASSRVSVDDVSIVSISSGSVVVLALVLFPSPLDADTFIESLTDDGSSVFTDPSFSSFGVASVTSAVVAPKPSTSESGGSLDGAGVPVEADACSTITCAAGVQCSMLYGLVASCGACPPGFVGDGVVCEDVDECATQADSNGGCDPKVECNNTPGGRECGACPGELRGDGYSGCREGASCADNNGGCDALAACVEAPREASGDVQIECGPCPPGFAGTGDTTCKEFDACASAPCFPGVACVDDPAPSMGFVCGACPDGTRGDGETCEQEQDPCATQSVCDPLSTCLKTPGGFTCAPCPGGYEGDGRVCEDVNECEQAPGPCAPQATCTNLAGGFECGACPSGFSGSGYTRCLAATDCSVDNGGCDELVTCSDGLEGEGAVVCGECPEGYAGDGVSGCTDHDACAASPCFAAVFCQDMPAPSTDFACGSCPEGMVGDGVLCEKNACFEFNGGCDPMVPCRSNATQPGARTCGACPRGYSDVFGDGTKCREVDGCAEEPCFPGVACSDLPAPAEGRVCGECPSGYEGDGAVCADVDECAGEGNGGCDPRTECINQPGGFVCGSCPEGYKGTGELGCKAATTCAEANGGCDALTACTDGVPTTCGPCPPGFVGSGQTACVEEDGCQPHPCFRGVECTDVPAPGTGFTCAGCPEGYRGDGVHCDLCKLRVRIIESTAVDGVMLRSRSNQVIGKLDGLDDPDCINTLGTSFQWEMTSSSGERVALLANENKAETLKLYLPKNSLTASKSYMVQLKASLSGQPTLVHSQAVLGFVVRLQELIPLVSGGGMEATEDVPITLDASPSFDPDSETGDMSFQWRCTRSDGEECRTADGALLPVRLTDPVLGPLNLQGSELDQLVYLFVLRASKGARSASVSTTIVILMKVLDAPLPPLLSIQPIFPRVPVNKKLILNATVSSNDPEGVSLQWAMAVLREAGPEIMDLRPVASTPLEGEILVIKSGSLQPGERYRFTVTASDRFSPPQGIAAFMDVQVNMPPVGGAVLVEPVEGISLETIFTLSAVDWLDDDQPLWYQFKYQVAGEESTQTLSEFSPVRSLSITMPRSGSPAYGHLLQVWLVVRDSFGSTSKARVNLTVKESVLEDAEAVQAFVGNLLSVSTSALSNGDSEGALLLAGGLASVLNRPGSDDHDERGSDSSDTSEDEELDSDSGSGSSAARETARQQRAELARLVESSAQTMVATSSSLEWVAQTMQAVVSVPSQVGPDTRNSTLRVMESVVSLQSSQEDSQPMSLQTSSTVLSTLSSLLSAPTAAANETAQVAASARNLADGVVASVASGLVDGEPASEVVSPDITAKVQNVGKLGSANCPLFQGPIQSAGAAGASVVMPSSMQAALAASSAGGAVVFKLMTMGSDPNQAKAAGTSDVVTISLGSTSEGGGEIRVRGLAEPITFSIPIAASKPETVATESYKRAACTWWDKEAGAYSTEGCVTMPNPAPRGALLRWRNVSNVMALNLTDQTLILDRAWEIGNANLTSACAEVYDARFMDFEGADEGLRKYAGDGCALADASSPDSCYWHWPSQTFQGSGCVHATQVECMCTHLTDFQAYEGVEVGEVRAPQVKVVSAQDMVSVSTADIAESTTLFSIWGGIVGLSVFLASLFNYQDTRARQKFLDRMFASNSTSSLWYKDVEGLWTWGFAEPKPLNAMVEMLMQEPEPRTSAAAKRAIRPRGAVPSGARNSWMTFKVDRAATGDEAGSKSLDVASSSPASNSSTMRWLRWGRNPAPRSRTQNHGPTTDVPSPVVEIGGQSERVQSSPVQRTIRAKGQAVCEGIVTLDTSGAWARRHAGVGRKEMASARKEMCVHPEPVATTTYIAPTTQSAGSISAGMTLSLASASNQAAPPGQFYNNPMRAPPSPSPHLSDVEDVEESVAESPSAFSGSVSPQKLTRMRTFMEEEDESPRVTSAPNSLAGSSRSLSRFFNGAGVSPTANNGEAFSLSIQSPGLSDGFKSQIGRMSVEAPDWVHSLVSPEMVEAQANLLSTLDVNFTLLKLCFPIRAMLRQAMDYEKTLGFHTDTLSGSTMFKASLSTVKYDSAAAMQDSSPCDVSSAGEMINLSRMLGTSLVLAALDKGHFITKDNLKLLLDKAAVASWRMPNNCRSFMWYYGLHKALLGLGPNQLRRVVDLVNIVLLQEADGFWQMSGSLSRALHAGSPRQLLSSSPLPDHPWENMWREMPSCLKKCLPKGSPDAGNIWATVLAMQFTRAEPFAFVENPGAPAKYRQTVDSRAEAWLTVMTTTHPELGDHMEALLQEASTLVSQWIKDHEQRIHDLHRQRKKRSKAELGRSILGSVTQTVGVALASHPVTALFLRKLADPLNGAERALLLVNTPLIMLTMCVAFYYSKSQICCGERKEVLGCPEADATTECMGYTTCIELKEAAELLPEELGMQDWACTAFPQKSSLMDKAWLVLIIMPIVLFSNVMINALFSMNRSGAVPAHFVPRAKPGRYARAKSGGLVPQVQALCLVLFGLFIQWGVFVKAVALFITRLIMLGLAPVQKVKRVLAPCIVSFKACVCASAHTPSQVPVKRPNTWTQDGSVVAYSYIAVTWLLELWILIVMGSQIRATMGEEEEEQLLTTWGLNVLAEQFGMVALRLLLMRLAVNLMFQQIDSIMTASDQGVMTWFNNHVADHLGDSSTVDLWTMLLNDNGVESADNLQVQI